MRSPAVTNREAFFSFKLAGSRLAAGFFIARWLLCHRIFIGADGGSGGRTVLGATHMEQVEEPDELTTPYGPCRQCAQWDVVKERIRMRELLDKAIAKIESDISKDNFKPTLGEYLKLVALEKDVEQDDIKEIRVTWVGPKATIREVRINYDALPSQQEFHSCGARFKGFSGPVGSGKSMALCQEALRLCYMNPGRTGLLGAPTYPMLREATMATLFGILDGNRIRYEHNKAENTLVLPDTGSRIVFRPVDDYERLRGTNLAWFGLDELTYAAKRHGCGWRPDYATRRPTICAGSRYGRRRDTTGSTASSSCTRRRAIQRSWPSLRRTGSCSTGTRSITSS